MSGDLRAPQKTNKKQKQPWTYNSAAHKKTPHDSAKMLKCNVAKTISGRFACSSVCMYVRMHACMHVFIYVWMYVCICVCRCVGVCVCAFMYMCMYACMCVSMYVHLGLKEWYGCDDGDGDDGSVIDSVFSPQVCLGTNLCEHHVGPFLFAGAVSGPILVTSNYPLAK